MNQTKPHQTRDEKPATATKTGAWIIAAWIIVCATGLFLSGFSYFKTNEIVQKTLEEKYTKIAKNNIEILSREVSNLEDMMDMASAMAKKGNFAETKSLLKTNNELIYLTRDENNQWMKQTLTKGRKQNRQTRAGTLKSEIDIINSFKKAETAPLKHFQIYTDPELFTHAPRNENRSLRMARPIATALFSESGTQKTSVLIMISTLDNTFSDLWLRDNDIAKLSISDNQNNHTLYTYQSHDNIDHIPSLAPIYEFSFANHTWEIKTQFIQTSHARILLSLPLTILAISLTLTLLSNLLFLSLFKQHKHTKQNQDQISAHKREAEEKTQLALDASKEQEEGRLENIALLDSVHDILFETDQEGTLLFLNKSWETITGLKIAHTLGGKLSELFIREEQSEHAHNFSKLIDGKKAAYTVKSHLKCADGESKTVTLSISMMRKDNKNDLRVTGTITDIEQRQQAEEALKEAETKYRMIVENAAGGIFQITPQGHFIAANPAMARILGYESPEALKNAAQNMHTQLYIDQTARTKMIRELKVIGTITNYESQIRHTSGSTLWINENIRSVTNETGEVLHFEGSIEDITQRKESEIAIHQAKAHSDMANRAKSEFLANMSHELRTPLNAIIGFSEIIKDEVLGKIENESYKEYALDIHKSGKNLLKIISEILDISKIEANERQLNESEISLEDIISDALELMKEKIVKKGIVIAKNKEAIPLLIAEKIALKQIITNILSNAIKFTPDRGQISISTGIDNQNRISLAITDTGVGLDQEEINKALSPFGQVSNALSRSGKGTGLGLTLSNALVKLHGGDLSIVSQKGIGTTVTIILPAERTSSIAAKTTIKEE